MGMVFNLPQFQIKVGERLKNELSEYTWEMLELLLAVQWVEKNKPLWTIICLDSSLSLACLDNSPSEARPDNIMGAMTVFYSHWMGVIAKFVWIPAHYVIVNEVADKIATQAAKGDQVGLHSSISKTKMRSTIKQKMRERWQKWCEEERTGR